MKGGCFAHAFETRSTKIEISGSMLGLPMYAPLLTSGER
jgi:hypothetical protein